MTGCMNINRNCFKIGVKHGADKAVNSNCI